MKKGFTLIETLVAVAIFSILVSIGVGGFTNALHTQRQIAALIAAQSNASIALEQMAREIRTGYLFCNDPTNNGSPSAACNFPHCSVAAGIGGSVWTCDRLDFYNANAQNVDYDLSSAGTLDRSPGGSGGTFTPITGDDVKVSNLSFTLFGNTEGDHWNPRITVGFTVAPNSSDPALAGDLLNLQTTVSAREIDCSTATTTSC